VGKKRKDIERERQRRGEGEKNLFSSSLCLANIFFDFRFPTLGHDKKSKRERPCVRTQRREKKGRGAQGRPTE